MSIIFPKVLSVADFGYWQIFLFYSSFVGFFHFGLNDGIYLRYGGRDIKEVRGELLKVQFYFLFSLQLLVFFLLSIYQYFYGREDLQLIVFGVLVLMVLNNLTSYLTSFFQAVNRLTLFSNTTIITSLSFLVLVFGLFCMGRFSLNNIMIMYLISYSIGMIYAVWSARLIFSAKINWKNNRTFFKQFKINTVAGSFLMISTIAGMLIIGVGRFLIEKKWGVVTFAVVSLAFTITTFMLFFVRQLGIVIFPVIKRVHQDSQKKYFLLGITFIDVLLLGSLLLVPLVNFGVTEILPKYAQSLFYFTLIVPIIIYEGKLQIMLNTYMKVKRKEKLLMYVNIVSLLVSVVFCFLGYYLGSLNLILVVMTAVTMLRGVALELYLNKMMAINNTAAVIFVLLMSVSFICLFVFFSPLTAWILYLCMYIGFNAFNYNKLTQLKKELTRP